MQIAKAIALMAVAGLAVQSRGQYSLQTLIYTGQSATGSPAPITSCGPAFIDPWGQTAVTLDPTISARRHIARGMTHLATIMKPGQALPDGGSGTISEVGMLRGYMPDGEFAVAYLEPWGQWNIVMGDPFSWSLMYIGGIGTPNHPGSSFTGLPHTVMAGPNRNLAIGYRNDDVDALYHAKSPGFGLSTLLSVGANWWNGDRVSQVQVLGVNAAGNALMQYEVEVYQSTATWRQMGYSTVQSTHNPFLASGDAAPGGGVFDPSLEPRGGINDARQVAFSWRVTGVHWSADEGIWVYTPDQPLQQVMREGLAIPGQVALSYGSPAHYTGDINRRRSVVIGGGGHVCFVARVQGTGVASGNDSALFAGRPGSIRMIAREGQPSATGEPAWGDFFDADCNYWINARGDVAFVANRADGGEGIWHCTADGQYLLRATATGRTLPTGGQSRTVYQIVDVGSCSGGQDGRGSPLNDNGQLAFTVQFQDNTYATYRLNPPETCYPNCDESVGTPLLTANDFACFVNRFAAGASYANCDGSTGAPMLTANDFACFLNAYAAGCS